MSVFTADWLAMREPYDMRARNSRVFEAAVAAFAGRSSVKVTDLACGTGSTLRAVAPRLPGKQEWKMLDKDRALLARAAECRHPGTTVTTCAVDLACDLEKMLAEPADFIVTSALLDLVSGDWLQRLVSLTVARQIPFYAAFTYDGRVVLDPDDPLDAAIIDAANEHQLRDKGFGPALGPGAPRETIALYERFGYSVVHGRADWIFGPEDRAIQLSILDGWADVAHELGRLPPPNIQAWRMRRRNFVKAGQSSMLVGHVDLFAALGLTAAVTAFPAGSSLRVKSSGPALHLESILVWEYHPARRPAAARSGGFCNPRVLNPVESEQIPCSAWHAVQRCHWSR